MKDIIDIRLSSIKDKMHKKAFIGSIAIHIMISNAPSFLVKRGGENISFPTISAENPLEYSRCSFQ